MSATSPKIAVPLARKATIVSVTVSQWTARKLDRKATKEVNNRHGASADAGRYNKLLIQTERLAKLTSLVSAARTLHYSLTRPWADEGARILPNALYVKFSNEFRKLKREFDQAADDFARGYPRFIEERRVMLKDLFDPADYPSVGEIRSKFRLDMTVMQFPDEADFRSDLDEDTVNDIRAEIAETSRNVIDNAMEHTATQIIKTVGHMATKLAEYNGAKAFAEPVVKGKGKGKKGKKAKAPKAPKPKTQGERSFFCASLVDNVRELAELLPAFNLTNNPELTAITDRIIKELCVEDASELRTNKEAREAVRASAEDIVKKMATFLA